MKKRIASLALLLILLLTACGGPSAPASETPAEPGAPVQNAAEPAAETPPAKAEEIELTLWTFPVGGWGNSTSVSSILTGFHRDYPNIHISVAYLDYETGDDAIAQAAAAGTLPDLVLEGPERLVANWGDKGWMADLTDLWNSEFAGAVYEPIREACQHSGGAYYVYPICMSAHCMAVNYDLFQQADALQYIDQETRTWTPEGFLQAVQALTDHGIPAGAVYCKNQSGDQGTRALVTNLSGGSFTDEDHTVYTVDTPENREALRLLYDLEGVTFEPELSSGDAIDQFCRGETAMCFCWNASVEVQQSRNSADLSFDVFPMAFPAEGTPRLQGGIWGFGVFDSGDDARVEAAKTFIRYLTDSDAAYSRAVLVSAYWPVREMENLYAGDLLMTEYSVFTPYLGDYYQVTPGWAEARTAWWQMLQKIGEGTAVEDAARGFPDPA